MNKILFSLLIILTVLKGNAQNVNIPDSLFKVFLTSQKDIDRVLELESRHFGALAGQGLVNIKLENYEKAIESYKRAQEIYPAMQSPKIMIEQIEQLIKQQLI